MQKKLIKTAIAVMKLSVVPVLVLLTFFNALAKNMEGQEILSKRVTISVKGEKLNNVLKEVSNKTGAVFFYSPEVIRAERKISADAKDMELAQFLDSLLTPLSIKKRVDENGNIFLNRTAGKPQEVLPADEDVFRAPPPRVITGKVTSADGTAIEGASVQLKNSEAGAATDKAGSFVLTVGDNDEVLVISAVGYEKKEVAITSASGYNITLAAATNNLNDVVVVAFGTQKKETVTGAISSIKTKEIKQSPAANLAVTLAGRLPGLTSIQRSGQPGRDVTQLFIRGQGTVNAQSPIVLVDGIERDLTYIDPNEIETITILKDASSTAIFGVRGANGVIMVTTKRGASETPEINFIAETSTQDFPRFITPVNSYDYATLRNLALRNDGLPEEFSADALEHYKKQDDPLRFPNTDWRSLLLKDYSLQQRYNLNISGANKAVKYFVNAGYLNQGGQFKTEKNLTYDPSFKLERYNFRSNIDVQLNKSLKIFLNVAGYLEQRNTPYSIGGDDPTNWIIYFMNRLPATVPGPTTPDGDVVTAGDVDRPGYGLVNRSGYIQQKRSNVLATFGMEQNLDFIAKGLSARAVASFDSRITNNLAASRSYAKYVQVINPNLPGSDGQDSVYYRQFNNDQNTPLSIGGDRAFETLSNIQFFLNYYRRFNKHSLTGLALYQQQSRIINNELPYKLKGAAARISYGYDNKYFLEFNAGYNGSEQFAKGNRYGFFPAVSASYVISNEQFLKGNNALTLLKLRGSYGLVGNDRIGSRRFLYLDDIQVNGGGFSGSLGNGQQIATNLLKNENLQWEVSKKTNIGLELGLFKDLNIIADVFFEKRDNILRNRGIIPVLNGFPVSVIPPVNLGIVENRGYEIEMSYRKIFSKNFSLLARVNMNHAVNKQIFADEPLLPDSYAYQYRETGYRIGQYFGYVVDSYFKDEDDVKNSPTQTVGGHESRPGDFKYKDLNGDGLVNERDQAPIGFSNVPEYQYGAAVSINYKDFDVSVLFQGVSNVSNYYAEQGVFATNGVTNYVARHLDSWTADKAAQGEPINYPRLSTQSSPNENANSFFIINAGYVRLKNVEIGYTLPLRWSQKIHSKRVRFYVSGLNLITWDKLPTKEFDPELTNSRVYPITRMYNAGINIAF